jgi:plasmid maintenance system antidote protein VapI
LIKKGGYKQSDVAREIGVSRQSLSYVVAGTRELSMSLALKLESFFNQPEGELLKMQVEESVHNYKLVLKRSLIDSLNMINAFWSYADVNAENVSDEELIEKVFIYLDLKDISLLFELYPRNYVRKVWRENMAIQGDYLFNLNVMIAMFYFDIKQPEKYFKRVEREHIKHISDYA